MFLSFWKETYIRLDADFKQVDVCDDTELYVGPIPWHLHD